MNPMKLHNLRLIHVLPHFHFSVFFIWTNVCLYFSAGAAIYTTKSHEINCGFPAREARFTLWGDQEKQANKKQIKKNITLFHHGNECKLVRAPNAIAISNLHLDRNVITCITPTRQPFVWISHYFLSSFSNQGSPGCRVIKRREHWKSKINAARKCKRKKKRSGDEHRVQ